MLTFAAKIIINQKHKMKKFYFLFLFVVAALFGVTAQAQVEIVTSVESPITTLETLKAGSKVMFYECGEEARRGYLKKVTTSLSGSAANLPLAKPRVPTMSGPSSALTALKTASP